VLSSEHAQQYEQALQASVGGGMANRREVIQGSIGGMLALGSSTAGLTPQFASAAEACDPAQPEAVATLPDETLWATWYDLPKGSETAFNRWLHEEQLPRLLKTPGYLWAAHYRAGNWAARDMAELSKQIEVKPEDAPGVGRGSQFLVLVGAVNAATFLPPPVAELAAGASDASRKMLDLRTGVRSEVYLDMARVNGPAASTRPARTAPASRIQFGAYRVREGSESQLWAEYHNRRLPYMSQLPDAVSARVMGCLSGWPTFGVFYEFANLAAHERFQVEAERGSHSDEALRGDPTRLDVRKIVTQAPGSPIVADRIWSAVRS
jgi:hypothetical protein